MRRPYVRFHARLLASCLRFAGLIAGLLAFGVGSSYPVSGADPELKGVIESLALTPTGRALLERARTAWEYSAPGELIRYVKWGVASKTDAVLTRHFDPVTGRESREREVIVQIRRDQPLAAMILDLAHELVHASAPPAWDPYDPELTPGKYIQASIEGQGGEVAAVATECQVGFELAALRPQGQRDHDLTLALERCQNYVVKTGPSTADAGRAPASAAVSAWGSADSVKVEPELVRRDFYRVGRWAEDLARALGSEVALFPLMTRLAPRLYSSTGNAPYPAALYAEYREITRIACLNTRRRGIASSNENLNRFLDRRCH